MAFLPLVLTIATTALSAVSKFAEARQNAKIERSNAKLAKHRAKEAVVASQEKARRFRRRLSRLEGEQKAGFAGSGVIIGLGTPGDVTADTRLEGEFQAELIERAGLLERNANLVEANVAKTRARRFKAAGFGTLLGGGLSAGSKFFGSTQGQSLLAKVGR